MEELKLRIEDSEDLEVAAAYLQDAVTLVSDLAYLPGARRFAAMVNRFRWEAGSGGKRGKKAPAKAEAYERVRTGLHFDQVLNVKARNIAQDHDDGVLNLLTMTFEETDAPSGIVTLVFSGGGEMRLEVEALEAQVADLGLSRKTANRPTHDEASDR